MVTLESLKSRRDVEAGVEVRECRWNGGRDRIGWIGGRRHVNGIIVTVGDVQV